MRAFFYHTQDGDLGWGFWALSPAWLGRCARHIRHRAVLAQPYLSGEMLGSDPKYLRGCSLGLGTWDSCH
jgi:hypothetical protein